MCIETTCYHCDYVGYFYCNTRSRISSGVQPYTRIKNPVYFMSLPLDLNLYLFFFFFFFFFFFCDFISLFIQLIGARYGRRRYSYVFLCAFSFDVMHDSLSC